MLNPNFKWNTKSMKRLGLSTVLIGTAVVGYSMADTTEVTDTPTVSQVSTPQPPAPGGRGGRHGGGDHDHDQELSDDAFDPNDLVTVEPEDDAITDEEAEDETVTPVAPLSEDQVYLDGQYIGDSIRADRWGNMQVVVVIEDGELTEVLIADYPRSTTLSDVISRNAMPSLISEAIEAQDADIDIVSGATDTSEAFIESLESALEEALIIQEEDTEGASL